MYREPSAKRHTTAIKYHIRTDLCITARGAHAIVLQRPPIGHARNTKSGLVALHWHRHRRRFSHNSERGEHCSFPIKLAVRRPANFEKSCDPFRCHVTDQYNQVQWCIFKCSSAFKSDRFHPATVDFFVDVITLFPFYRETEIAHVSCKVVLQQNTRASSDNYTYYHVYTHYFIRIPKLIINCSNIRSEASNKKKKRNIHFLQSSYIATPTHVRAFDTGKRARMSHDMASVNWRFRPKLIWA